MSKYEQKQHNHQDAPEQQDGTNPPDQRNKKLGNDVECCLAEIDEILDDEMAERENALIEAQRIRDRYNDDEDVAAEMRLWQAKYAHLQLHIGISCCTMYVLDKGNGRLM